MGKFFLSRQFSLEKQHDEVHTFSTVPAERFQKASDINARQQESHYLEAVLIQFAPGETQKILLPRSVDLEYSYLKIS